MLWYIWFVIVAVSGNDEAAVKNPGITQFWTDDYKVFDQIYGRTSDKSLYGGTLPPSISYDVDSNLKLIRTLKNEDTTASGSQINAYGLGNNFANLRQRVKQSKEYFKPTKNVNLIYNLYKPITEENDPETFDYFKHLEQLGKQEVVQHTPDYQPYANKLRNVDAFGSYKSIQDILDAQEDKKKFQIDNDKDNIEYVNYPQNSRKKENKPRYIQGQRCANKSQGRCRKRSNYNYGRPSYRPRGRPVVRKIKHTVVTD